MKKLYFALLFILLTAPTFLNAGTPHSVSGTVTYEAGGSPATITFTASITTRPDEILTESSAGCGYDAGSYWVQCGNYPTTWTAGDTLSIDISDGIGGIAYDNVVLTNDPNDPLNLIIYPPDIQISPTSKDYGAVLTGNQISQSFVLSNEGISPLAVTSTTITGSSDFSITSGGGTFALSENENRNIVVRFSPSSVGNINANLVIQSNDPDEGTLSVPLSGEGAGHPDIAVSIQNLNFGSVYLNASQTYLFQVISEGSADLSIAQMSIVDDPQGQFAIKSGGGAFTLSPGNQRTVTVEFSPVLPGIQQATLEIENNDTDENPKQVFLSGTGIVQDISISPPSYDYGDVILGKSQTQTFTISNDGNADLTISQLNFTGTNNQLFTLSSAFSQTIIIPGESLQIGVVFEPNNLGTKTASLEVVSNDPDENPFTIPLSGKGVAPDIAVTPATMNYGFIPVGNYSTQMFIIQNEGDSPLNIDEISIQGNDLSDFFIIQGSAPKTISPSNTYNVSVRFQPETIGEKSAILRIGCDDPDDDPYDIPLSGNVESPDIQSDVTTLDYGSIILGSPLTQSVQISNAGQIDLEISQISITGSNADLFHIQSGGDPISLSEGQSVTINIQFNPGSVGEKMADLQITSNDPDENPLQIQLTGVGSIADMDPPYLKDIYPPTYSYGVPTNATFQFKVMDDLYGPDLQKLNVTLDQLMIIRNGQDQTGGQVQIQSCENYLQIHYNPLTRLEANNLMMVRIRCNDLSDSANYLDYSYQLHTGSSYIIYIYQQTQNKNPFFFEEPNTGFQINAEENALNDTFNLILGYINEWPVLPDSIEIIDKVFVLDPYGLEFSKPVTVSVPYNEKDLADAGISLDETVLLMFHPKNNRWQNIPIQSIDSEHITISIDRLSYFALGKNLNSTVSVEDLSIKLPIQFSLSQNYPNPFNHQTHFVYALPKPSPVKMEIYDARGRSIAKYNLGMQSPGEYHFNWDSIDMSGQVLPSGIYLLKYQAGDFVQLRKMLLVR